MLWTSWTPLVPILVLAFLLLVSLALLERRAVTFHLLVAPVCALVFAAGYLDLDFNLSLSDLSPHNLYMNTAPHINLENLDRFCEENATMLLFSAAVVWYDPFLGPQPIPAPRAELACPPTSSGC